MPHRPGPCRGHARPRRWRRVRLGAARDHAGPGAGRRRAGAPTDRRDAGRALPDHRVGRDLRHQRDRGSGAAHRSRRRGAVLEQGPRAQPMLDLRPRGDRRALGPAARRTPRALPALLGLRALARAIDAKDPATRQHSERVAELAGKLARAVGWSPRARPAAERGRARARRRQDRHPETRCCASRPRSPTRSASRSRHAELAARIVEDVLIPEQVEWIRTHHERPDGRGYPRGLRGPEIPEGGGAARRRRRLGRDDRQPGVRRAQERRRGAGRVRAADRPAVHARPRSPRCSSCTPTESRSPAAPTARRLTAAGA